jgi:redox-sensing transcriptional repressor
MTSINAPDIVVSRLPLYLRALNGMASEGQKVTSSKELGERLGISAAQIRKDLSHFGEFGKQGTGYQIAFLRTKLGKILHVDREWAVALVGMGDIGHAVVRYQGFAGRGFRIALIFDSDPAKVGQMAGGLQILAADQIGVEVKARGVRVAMLCVPGQHAQAVTNKLVDAGVRSILNYAPVNLSVPAGVRVQYIDPVIELQRMSYFLR